jgi:hypothetical protein
VGFLMCGGVMKRGLQMDGRCIWDGDLLVRFFSCVVLN